LQVAGASFQSTLLRGLKALIAPGAFELRSVPCACPPGVEATRYCNHGRACGLLIASGRDVGSTMIQERLARPW